MPEAPNDAGQLQALLDRLQAGDPAAENELLGRASEQLRRLASRMLKDFGRVKRWEQTDDVFQNAMLRLWSSLRSVKPRTVKDFCGLAALQMRRELIDLARQYYGPEGLGAHHLTHTEDGSEGMSPAIENPADTTYEPGRLAVWTEFHEQVEALPVEEREVVDLVWYQGLPQPQAASILGVSEPTLKRRWWSARRRLHEALKGHLPGT